MERGGRVGGRTQLAMDPHLRQPGAPTPAGPGKRTLAMGLSAETAPAQARRATPGNAVPAEGLGGGGKPDLTLDPENDLGRNTLDLEAPYDGAPHNPMAGGRPVDPEHLEGDGWGSKYPEDCHGIPAFKNIVDDLAERQRIASLHNDGRPGPDLFGLTVPFNGGLAYQCVEFVSRYYREALGHGALGGGHAKTYLQGTRGGLEVHRFPTSARPQAGDLLVEEAGPSPVGHVGIVQSVSGDPGGPLRVTVIQQNRGRSSAASYFNVTPTQQDQTIGGVTRPTTVYTQDGDWAGFRRKPGVKPVESLGGYSNNKGLGRPDMGGGNYIVQAGQTVSLSDVTSMYGLTVDALLGWNPGINTSVTAPADHSIEILVTDSFRPSEQSIGTVQTTRRAILRGDPSTSHSEVGILPQDATVWVYEVVSGEQVTIQTPETEIETSQTRRSQDWYRIATFTGVTAYVSAALCTELGGQGTGTRTRNGR